ncbi:MAG: hypothetical protein RLZZ184_2384, partial [Cyanobacteriota bacterium]
MYFIQVHTAIRSFSVMLESKRLAQCFQDYRQPNRR